MTVELMQLPYPYDGLEPAMSRETLSYHHGKHHRGYVARLNTLVEKSNTRFRNLEQLVRDTRGEIFNNAAQVWNHDFFWQCLRPESAKPAPEALVDAIAEQWESLYEFQKEFESAARDHFASGWAWLIMDQRGRLRVTSAPNADTPIRHGLAPLLACDVWEHAYYIDYRNRRDEYLNAFWTVVNWDFVEAQRQAALRQYQPDEGSQRIRMRVG
jgi:Fe-Mn family superoxide dismutase